MKSLFAVLAICLCSQAALAEKLYCQFYKPYIKVVYDPDTNRYLETTYDSGEHLYAVTVSFQSQGIIKITALNNSSRLVIDTTKEGADGETDLIWPFDAVFNETLRGGCETETIHKRPKSPLPDRAQ